MEQKFRDFGNDATVGKCLLLVRTGMVGGGNAVKATPATSRPQNAKQTCEEARTPHLRNNGIVIGAVGEGIID